KYSVPNFLEAHGYPSQMLEPRRWYEITKSVRVCSIPVPIDDSILIIETPNAVIFNINDSAPRLSLLGRIKEKFNPEKKTTVVLKSYTPASAAALTFKNGVRSPFKTKKDFVQVAEAMSKSLGAKYFIPFASQAFFNREDSKWAN